MSNLGAPKVRISGKATFTREGQPKTETRMTMKYNDEELGTLAKLGLMHVKGVILKLRRYVAQGGPKKAMYQARLKQAEQLARDMLEAADQARAEMAEFLEE